MRLLLDENISPKLVPMLAQEYPGTVHVVDIGLRGATDGAIWDFAKSHGYAIVSKDTDFRERSYFEGHPPKVIWLDVGNKGTAAIAALLIQDRSRLEGFSAMAEYSFLVVS